jgi:hypothetical protein
VTPVIPSMVPASMITSMMRMMPVRVAAYISRPMSAHILNLPISS